MEELNSKIKLTDKIEIDMDYLPIDIILNFMEIYQGANMEETILTNNILVTLKLTRIMEKTDILDQIIKWAKPGEDVKKVKKKVKSKYEINVYLNLFARAGDYINLNA